MEEGEFCGKQKNATKKMLNLLRNSSNKQFVSLIANSFKQRLINDNHFSQQILQLKLSGYLIKQILLFEDQTYKNKEFSRIVVTENLIKTLFFFDFDQELFFKAILEKLNCPEKKEKAVKYLENYPYQIIPISEEIFLGGQKQINGLKQYENLQIEFQTLFQLVNVSTLLKDQKQIEHLINGCKPLMRDLEKEAEQNKNKLTKEQIMAEIDKNLDESEEEKVGEGFKLSNFIDPKFLEECALIADQNTFLKTNKLQNLNEYVVGTNFIGQLNQLNKRQKTEKKATKNFILLSPSLALLQSYSQVLTSEVWESRQVAAQGLSVLLQQSPNFYYAIISQNDSLFQLNEIIPVETKPLIENVLCRCVISLFKDQFKDYEDVNMVMPVRAHLFKLLQVLLTREDARKDFDQLIQVMPMFLMSCEDNWQNKQNFFLFFKAMAVTNSKEYLFEVYGKQMIIQSILRVEDCVRVLITQIISEFLEFYFRLDQQNNEDLLVDQILNNLTEALRMSDDIEGSAIPVFSLVVQILADQRFMFQKTKFSLDVNVYFPFNFHHVLKVRIMFHKLINQLLILDQEMKVKPFTQQALFDLHTLIVQSLLLEDNQELVSLLETNLLLTIQSIIESDGKNLRQYVEQYLSGYLFMPQRFQKWLYQPELTKDIFQECIVRKIGTNNQQNQGSFLYFESPFFEKPNHEFYFGIVFKPVSGIEKKRFYAKKTQAAIKILAIIGLQGKIESYIFSFLKMISSPQMISLNSIIMQLVISEMTQFITQNQNKFQRNALHKLYQFNPNFDEYLLKVNSDHVNSIEDGWLQEINQKFTIALQRIQGAQNSQQIMVLTQFFQEIQKHLNFSQQNSLHYRTGQQNSSIGPLIQISSKQFIDQAKSSLMAQIQSMEQPFSAGGRQVNIAPVRVPPSVKALAKEIEDLIFNMFQDYDEQAQVAKIIAIGLHLFQVLSSVGDEQPIVLHSKLNNLIYPLWNTITLPKNINVHIQEINRTSMLAELASKTACIYFGDYLISTLDYLKKENARDAVILMVLKAFENMPIVTLEQAMDFDHGSLKENEIIEHLVQRLSSPQDMTTKLEIILEQWLCSPRFQKSSTKIFSYLANFSQNIDLQNAQQAVNILGRFASLLIHKKACQSGQIQNLLTDIAVKIMNSQIAVYHLPQTITRLITLLIKEQADSILITRIMVALLEQLECQNEMAFYTLKDLLEGCIGSSQQNKIQQQWIKETEALPSYLIDTLTSCQKLLLGQKSELFDTKIQSQNLTYLPLFFLTTLKSLGRSQIVMQCLAMLIQLLPLMQSFQQKNQQSQLKISISEYCLQNQQNYLIEVLEKSESFLSIFHQKANQEQILLPVMPRAELRDYQKQGIQWMIKLANYGLNCALCDDMGLGKTIQSISVVLNESYSKILRNFPNLGIEQIFKTKGRPVSLVICPNTLTYQWHKEVEKFFGQYGVTSLLYEPINKTQVMKQALQGTVDIIIISYEKARQDYENLKQIQLFYLILDEGHRIKNSKSQTTQKIKQLISERRLVLTGTPLQNRVSELWSIFDFLMPSFLEEEKVFNAKYNQFLTGNLSKLADKVEETQSFLKALKSLKQRIQPFIMRRTKIEVLKDLPPKFIQDFDCQMPQSQAAFYKYFDKNFPISKVTQGEQQQNDGKKQAGQQIFQNLILHRKVCNHPTFVIDLLKQYKNQAETKNQQAEINQLLAELNHGSTLQHSAKLLGLIDLLNLCEILEGQYDNEQDTSSGQKPKKKKIEKASTTESIQITDIDFIDSIDLENDEQNIQISRPQIKDEKHRALIFCQMKSFQQMVIDLVLKPNKIKYLYLDSMLSGQERFECVEKFNTDDSYKVMIMTTAVGGLGLNLTGADTVIFMEHDWNPMKDLQAIDRAHRIGQTRVVNVYRLIVRDTIEEKIMGLQRFKENLARNLIQSQGQKDKQLTMEQAQNMQVHELIDCFEGHTAVEVKEQKGGVKGQYEFDDEKMIEELENA